MMRLTNQCQVFDTDITVWAPRLTTKKGVLQRPADLQLFVSYSATQIFLTKTGIPPKKDMTLQTFENKQINEELNFNFL